MREELQPYVLDRGSFRRIYEFVRNNPMTVLSELSPADLGRFLLASQTILVDLDGQGIVIVDITRLQWDANVHVLFWEKRLQGQEERLKETLAGVFDEFKLRRLQAPVPTRNHIFAEFLTRIGFRREARLRCVLSNDRDCFVFGLLAEELNNGRMAATTEASTVMGIRGYFEDDGNRPPDQSGIDRVGDEYVSELLESAANDGSAIVPAIPGSAGVHESADVAAEQLVSDSNATGGGERGAVD